MFLKGKVLFSLVSALMVAPAGSDAQGPVERATLAGGCFWCMVHPFENLDGVLEVKSGYTGGDMENPSYRDVVSGKTGHVEAVQIVFDPSKMSYSEIVDLFWREIDPTDPGGQFVDRGNQYATAIFYHSEAQKRTASKSRDLLDRSGTYDKPIVTEIRAFSRFYDAEAYHQDYHQKDPMGYRQYRSGSGRDQYLSRIWKKPPKAAVSQRSAYRKKTDDELRKILTPLQYRVAREDGTEPPFDNAYWNNKDQGIYVDVVSGEPLFSSLHKYDSGTGWPSFSKPLVPEKYCFKRGPESFFRKDRSAKPSRGFPPRSPVSGWAASQGTSLLYEFRRPSFCG